MVESLASKLFELKELQGIIQSGKWRDNPLFSNFKLEDIDNLNFIIDLMEQKRYGIIGHD